MPLLLRACWEGCFSAVQATDKSPQAHTQTHCVWHACTPAHTGWMVYFQGGLCVLHFGSYLWVKISKYCKHLWNTAYDQQGCRGPARLSDCHPDWEERGFGDESCSCIFYNLFCNHLLHNTITYAHAHRHTKTQSSKVKNVSLFNRHHIWSYTVCTKTSSTHTHTGFYNAELRNGSTSSNTPRSSSHRWQQYLKQIAMETSGHSKPEMTFMANKSLQLLTNLLRSRLITACPAVTFVHSVL